MPAKQTGTDRIALRWFAAVAMLLCFCIGGLGLQACGGKEQPPPTGGCAKDEDCAKEATNKVCDKNTEKCVQCLKTDDCGKGELCDLKGNTCQAGCNTADDCGDLKKERGDKAKIECKSRKCVVKCDQKADCNPEERCSESQCVPNTCTEDANCGTGEKCDGNKCVPKGKIAGKYQSCSDGEICEDALNCLSYKGGTSQYCYKKCDKGCDKDEVCVKEDSFADGHNVCMKAVTDEGAVYNYDEGTACSDKLVTVTHGSVNFGSCWKTCTDKCLGDLKCFPHPNIEDDKQKFCFKACKADSDCPKGSSCKEHSKANNEFYCIP